MSDDDAFVAAIRASPDDALLRLVYADWLDERGDPRGRFVRLEVEAAGRDSDDPDVNRLRHQLSEIADALELRWLASVCRVALWDSPEPPFEADPADFAPTFVVSEEEQARVRHVEELARRRTDRWWSSSYFVLLAFAFLLVAKILAFFVRNPILLR